MLFVDFLKKKLISKKFGIFNIKFIFLKKIFNDILFFDIELNGIINIDEIEKWKNIIKKDKINDERKFSKKILKFFNQTSKELSQIDLFQKFIKTI